MTDGERFSLNLTFSNDVFIKKEENITILSYDGGTADLNTSWQSNMEEKFDPSVLDQAFVEENGDEDSFMLTVPSPLPSQNILECSYEDQNEVITPIIDDVNIAESVPDDESAAGIITNSSSSILMMADLPTRQATFREFATSNHVSFGSKMEKSLNIAQKESLERILNARMKSKVWMNREVERSEAILRLYRLRTAEESSLQSNNDEGQKRIKQERDVKTKSSEEAHTPSEPLVNPYQLRQRNRRKIV